MVVTWGWGAEPAGARSEGAWVARAASALVGESDCRGARLAVSKVIVVFEMVAPAKRRKWKVRSCCGTPCQMGQPLELPNAQRNVEAYISNDS